MYQFNDGSIALGISILRVKKSVLVARRIGENGTELLLIPRCNW